MIFEEGLGFFMFLLKGMEFKNELLKFWREIYRKVGYIEIEFLIILNRKLWEILGYWYYYKENMYIVKIDDEDYVIKFMNCFGGLIYYNF